MPWLSAIGGIFKSLMELLGKIAVPLAAYLAGRKIERGSVAEAEADKRREDDKIDAAPMTPERATELARKLAAGRQ